MTASMFNKKDREEQEKLWWKIQRMSADDAIRAIQEEFAGTTAGSEEISVKEPKVVGKHIIQIVRYSGEGDSTRKYAEEMVAAGLVETVRQREGNLRYEFFFPMEGNDVVLESAWESWDDLAAHYLSPTMEEIRELLKKNNLHMTVSRFRPVAAKDLDELMQEK